MGWQGPGTTPATTRHRTTGCPWLIIVLAAVVFGAKAPEVQESRGPGVDMQRMGPSSPAFVGTAKPFDLLMSGAMASMDGAMKSAPMTGDPDHDFAAMMIPHHQGAIDMAKAELLYGKDPVLRRLAQEIIVTQTSEITVMQRELGEQRTSGTMQH